jgi:hypothetical protein
MLTGLVHFYAAKATTIYSLGEKKKLGSALEGRNSPLFSLFRVLSLFSPLQLLRNCHFGGKAIKFLF